jgi:hypothetical protein
MKERDFTDYMECGKKRIAPGKILYRRTRERNRQMKGQEIIREKR